jgi:hypothetical protein
MPITFLDPKKYYKTSGETFSLIPTYSVKYSEFHHFYQCIVKKKHQQKPGSPEQNCIDKNDWLIQ